MCNAHPAHSKCTFKLQYFPSNSAIQTRPKKFFLAQILHTFSKRFLSYFSIFSTVIHSINRLSTIFRLIHNHSDQLRKTGKAPCKTSASPCKAQQKRPARRCHHPQNRSFISIFANYSIFHQKPCNPMFPRLSSVFLTLFSDTIIADLFVYSQLVSRFSR